MAEGIASYSKLNAFDDLAKALDNKDAQYRQLLADLESDEKLKVSETAISERDPFRRACSCA